MTPALNARDTLEVIGARFWRYVRKSDGCWEWAGRRQKGYGVMSVRTPQGKQAPRRAHRVALLLSGLTIPSGAIVCHHCDNPACVRPDHLFVGSNADNTADMIRKGRQFAMLTPEQVRDMRAAYCAGGVTQRQLARRYGVCRPHVSDVLSGQAWRSEPVDVEAAARQASLNTGRPIALARLR